MGQAANGFVPSASLERLLGQLPDKYDRQVKTLRNGLTAYLEVEEKASKVLRSELRMIKAKADASGTPLAAADLLSQVEALEQWLENGGQLPKSDLLLGKVLGYVKLLATARERHVEKRAGPLIKSLSRDGSSIRASELAEAVNELGQILNANDVLKEGKAFGGFRVPAKAGKIVRIRIHIEKVLGSSFSGSIERDMGISEHPVHAMSGGFKGMYFVANTLGSRRPGGKLDGGWQYRGYVIGRTIIGEYSGRGLKGKPGRGYFRLDMHGR